MPWARGERDVDNVRTVQAVTMPPNLNGSTVITAKAKPAYLMCNTT